MAGTPKTRASDFTGRQRDKAIKDNAEELARRSQEMSMATQAAAEAEANEVVDLTVAQPLVLEEVEVELAEKETIIRVNEDIDMTFANDRYEMKVGPKYKVPQHVADWLDEKGVVWH